MRIHVLSDLHLEMGPLEPPRVDADVTVLAGDIWTQGRGVRWAAEAFPDRPVLYVLGNHEYYQAAWPGMLEEMKVRARGSNVTILERDAVEVNGVRFLGCTLWSDFQLLGDPELAMAHAALAINDYHQIRVSSQERRLRPADTAGIHRQSVEWLRRELGDSERPTVVVTHNAPSPLCLVGREAVEPYHAAYLSDLGELITELGPELWIYGHIHQSNDFTLGGTRVLSNQKGYPFEECADFEPGKVVEVSVGGG